MAKAPANNAAQRVRKKVRKNVADGIASIEADPELDIPEVQRIVDFIRSSDRGIISH